MTPPSLVALARTPLDKSPTPEISLADGQAGLVGVEVDQIETETQMTIMNPIGIAQDTLHATHPTFDARAMTGDDGLAQIVLDDKVYTLRITRAGKLILTK